MSEAVDGREPAPVILEVRELKKVFRTGHEDLTVFEGVSFSVREGTTTVISGESGSGKTTLLNLVGTLESASSGQVLFRGRELTGKQEAELTEFRSRTFGFIFQFHYLLKDLTALENVLIPALIVGSKVSAARRRAETLLHEVGLARRAHHYPVQLSGGERQRVAVARALMNEPELILADEPTGNLDEKNSQSVKEILFDLVRAYGKTMLLVTHAADLAGAGDAHFLLEHRRLRAL